MEPVAADLASQFSLSIVSKDEAAALPVLRALMADLRRNAFDRPVELHVVDSLTRPLAAWRDSALTARATTATTARWAPSSTSCGSALERRYAPWWPRGGLAALADEPYLVVVW